MNENRHLRFADIAGLSEHDLPLAAEVWLDDLSAQFWVTREILKLANLFKRYLGQPDPKMLVLSHIETECHIDKDSVIEALRQMYSYGAVKGYAIDNSVLRVSLQLSIRQRLRVVEASQRWTTHLAVLHRGEVLTASGRPLHWVPEGGAGDEDVVEQLPA